MRPDLEDTLPARTVGTMPGSGAVEKSPLADAEDSEDEGLLPLWRRRAIDLRRLTWPLRLAVAVTIVAALVSAALIVLRNVPQPQLILGLGSGQPNAPISTAAFAVAVALWLIAWSAALTGALFGHWALRILVFAAYVYVSIDSVLLHTVTLIYLAPLVVLALWIGAISVLEWSRPAQSLPSWLPAVSFGVVLICQVAQYALDVWVVSLLHISTLVPQATLVAFGQLVLVSFDSYSFFLLPVLFLTGSDFAEWAEAVADQGNSLLRRFRSAWPLAGATIAVAVAILAVQLIQSGIFAPFDAASGLVLVSSGVFGCLVILLLLGIVRLGSLQTWPRLAVPPSALVAATVAVMALLVGPAYVSSFIIAFTPTSTAQTLVTFLVDHIPSAPVVFGVIPLALGLVIGVPLLMRGRRRPRPSAMAGLFLVMFSLYLVLLFLPQIIALFGVPIDRIDVFAIGGHVMRLSGIPILNDFELQTVVPFATLVIVAWFIGRRRIGDERATRVMAALLSLNVGLQLILWLIDAFSASDQLAERFTVAQGVLLVLAFLWDLLTSGEQVTNGEGRLTPRFARVLIYLGYSLLSISQVLFFSTLQGSSGFDFSGQWTDYGLRALGIPLVLAVVLLRLARSGSAAGKRGGESDEPAAVAAVYLPSGLPSQGSEATRPA